MPILIFAARLSFYAALYALTRCRYFVSAMAVIITRSPRGRYFDDADAMMMLDALPFSFADAALPIHDDIERRGDIRDDGARYYAVCY